jgi:hypothetical protein
MPRPALEDVIRRVLREELARFFERDKVAGDASRSPQKGATCQGDHPTYSMSSPPEDDGASRLVEEMYQNLFGTHTQPEKKQNGCEPSTRGAGAA